MAATEYIHPKLMTEMREVRYDFQRRIGFVYMPPSCCTHGPGAIALFETIDPDVQMVVTLAGGKLDTTYFKTGKVRRGSTWGTLVPQGGELRYSPSELEQDEVNAAAETMLSLPEVQDPRVPPWASPSSEPPRAAARGAWALARTRRR
jgi:hypothetical protein